MATARKLHVGDLIKVHLGKTVWQARFIEDRGPIGIKGRHLFRVQLLGDRDEPLDFVEVPKANIEPSHR